jgi:hypothetical protein
MPNWYYDEPTDETAQWNRRVVYTEDMIVREHTAQYEGDVGEYEVQTQCPLWTREQIIADWLICCWASPTDMPPGEYITQARAPMYYECKHKFVSDIHHGSRCFYCREPNPQGES